MVLLQVPRRNWFNVHVDAGMNVDGRQYGSYCVMFVFFGDGSPSNDEITIFWESYQLIETQN